MIDLEEKLKINELIDTYGPALTDKQFDVLKGYYQFDNSLAEIATDLKITRQAVFDMISKGVAQIENLEKKLGLCQKLNKIKFDLEKISKDTSAETKSKLNKIINRI